MEVLELVQPISSQAEAKPPKVYPINKQNAAELGRRGAEARKRALEELKAKAAAKNAIAELEPEEKYRLNRLARVREQLEMLDKELEDASDPKSIKALADSIRALTDVEFALANRSKPGLTRPKAPSNKRTQASSGPIDAAE